MEFGENPAIIAPVMRHLVVGDVSRSLAFYRDILGFEMRAGEAVFGPARFHFEAADGPLAGPAILFFETNDVMAMHAAIAARGGKPSIPEKVNWIKMEMFEVRDPDGHTLWFGQSYDKPHMAGPRPMLLQALPELPLDDVAAGVAYYRDVLGFKINHQQDDLGVMDRDQITLVLIQRTERHKGIGSTYVYVADIDALYAELRAKGAKVDGEPVSHPWGLRDFLVRDLEGNQIRFGQPFE